MKSLLLVALPVTLRGIYGATKDQLGARQRYAHPEMADALAKMEADGFSLKYSDIYRSAESSLARRREFEARGGPQLAARPSESPHNFGLAVDLDVSHALKTYALDKARLDVRLQSYGFFCHRRDHQLAAESWHYNFLGTNAPHWLASASTRSTSRAIEAKIQSLYGEAFKMSPEEVRAALESLKYASVAAFQGDWGLEADGIAGAKTQRLLSLVLMEKERA